VLIYIKTIEKQVIRLHKVKGLNSEAIKKKQIYFM